VVLVLLVTAGASCLWCELLSIATAYSNQFLVGEKCTDSQAVVSPTCTAGTHAARHGSEVGSSRSKRSAARNGSISIPRHAAIERVARCATISAVSKCFQYRCILYGGVACRAHISSKDNQTMQCSPLRSDARLHCQTADCTCPLATDSQKQLQARNLQQ
jgi:hypothetical protein